MHLQKPNAAGLECGIFQQCFYWVAGLKKNFSLVFVCYPDKVCASRDVKVFQ
jgi:hypothetical protein